MQLRKRLFAAIVLGFVTGLVLAPALAGAQQRAVLVTTVDGIITPVIADHLSSAVDTAESEGYHALIVEMNTPGGLDTSMREIIQSFLGANVPVVVYVSPSGGRAASAGALITFSAHVAAMAPGTTIGAATPVSAESGETASDKIINDAAAFAESVAAQRGRNTEFAVDTVRKGRAEPADEALRLGAIDLIASDRAVLLAELDGRTVLLANGATVTLQTSGAQITELELSPLRKLLQIIADPNLAFLFLSIGTLAVIYEAATPGMGFSGVAGVILLILGFFALSVLPVNVAGIALLVLALALFLAEVFTPGIGVFAVGGAVSLALAGLFLFEGPEAVRVDPWVFVPTAAAVGLGALIAGRLAWKARGAPAAGGAAPEVGAVTTVGEVNPDGITLVYVAGAWWRARSGTGAALRKGQRVRVTAVQNLILLVEPVESEGD